MTPKHYLFYEKKTLKQRWTSAPLSEKIVYIVLGLYSLLLLSIGIALCVLAKLDNPVTIILVLSCFVFAFPVMVYWTYRSIKSYYVILEEDCVYQSQGRMFGRRKVDYSEVSFLIGGNVGPYIFPYKSSPEICHQTYGNYINALSRDKKVLFVVRYSAEMEAYLKQKCKNAELLDIADWNRRNTESEEIKAADRELVERYKGMVQ